MASTNWDTYQKRRRPPAWDPPKLLLVVVSGLHVVVGTSSVVGVIIDAGVWLLGSNVWLRHPGRRGKMGKRGSKAIVSTHPKYSQASVLQCICVKRPYQWTELQNAGIRGG